VVVTYLKHNVAVYISRNRRQPVLQFAARAARRYIEIIENRHYEFSENGEQWLLRRIATCSPTVVFDVGANVGDWAAEVVRVAPDAQVHAFELVPATARQLSDRFRCNPRVTVVGSGLLDEPGTAQVRHYPSEPVLSGVVLKGVTDVPHPVAHEWLDVPVTRGDDYCAERGVDHIDLLKIDAEGSDHLVLKGFARMLEGGSVGAVQFEYGRANALNRFLLADFYELLEAAGMRVGKLYPSYVDFRDYDVLHEDFIGPNFVAVHRDRRDLLDALGAR
jgi:FkbM family methyltransferase